MTEGERVGVMASFNRATKRALFLGYGVYRGEKDLGLGGLTTAKIEMDSGETVYGHECWWAPEAVMRDRIVGMLALGYTVSPVTLPEWRES